MRLLSIGHALPDRRVDDHATSKTQGAIAIDAGDAFTAIERLQHEPIGASASDCPPTTSRG